MNKSQLKQPQIKLQIHINDHVKFGKIAYKHDDLISKVFHDLKRIKILPDKINQYQVKYLDKDNQELNKNHQFSSKFDANSDFNLIKIVVPDNSINLQETTKKADQYIKSSRQKRRQLKQMSEAENLVRNLKPIFSLIHDQKYGQISSVYDSQEYSSIIQQYSNEHKEIALKNQLYEWMLTAIVQEKFIDIQKLKLFQEISRPGRQKIQEIIKRYNLQIEQEEQKTRLILMQRQSQLQEQQEKNIQLTYQIDRHELNLKRREAVIKDLEQDIKQKQNNFQKYQRDNQEKIQSLQSQIQKLKQELTRNENRFQKQIQLKQKEIERISFTLPKQRQVSQHQSNYFKYFLNKNLVLNQVALHPIHSKRLLEALSKNIQSHIEGFSLLYKYETPSISNRFHKLTDFKNNILIIAQTKQGRVFGGFSNLPFDPYQRKHSPSNTLSNVKSFLFSVYKDELLLFPIKPNYDSVIYEQDFIVFGNEQICINRQQAKVQSLFVNDSKQYLHYNDVDEKRNFFLSDNGQQQADLQNYEIYQIVT